MSGKSKGSALQTFLKFGLFSAVAGVLSVSLLAPAVAVAGVAATTGIGMFEGLPSYIRPITSAESSTVYALKNGEPVKMATFFHENRVEVPFEAISPNLVNAVIATEDPRFYEHGGVDIISLVRATLTNLATFGEGPGASTITMQYVRQSLVEAANLTGDASAIAAATEVTVERKLREIRLSIALEQKFSKKEILAGYMNLVFLGNQINGVETASRYYFGTSARNLNVPQAAYLAAMLKSPNDYKPDEADNLERGIGRRNYVLQQMSEAGYISQKQADSYKASPIQTDITKTRQGCQENQLTAFFCDFTVWTIRNSPEFGVTPEEREILLRRGGLEIYTSLDLSVQQVAWDTTMTDLPPENEWGFGTASVSVEVGTGRIISMAQNRYFDQATEPVLGGTSVNYNTDKNYGGSSGFQPGSTYKVFTLAQWLNDGFTLGEHVDGRIFTGEDVDLDGIPDPVKIWNVERDFRASCGGVAGLWEVNNSGDQTVDDISIYQAFVTSQNTAFAAMASQLDLCAIRDSAKAFGVHRADGNELEYFPATILGTNEISPLAMAAAYAGISNAGLYCSPVAIDKVLLRRTKEELPVPKTQCSQAVTPEVAAAMTHVMRAVISGGTGAAANPGDGTPLAGKTGTTDRRIHTWMIGFSTKVATATWVGNVVGLTSQSSKSINGRAVSTIRHSIWKEIMREADKHYQGEAFPSPDPRYVSAPMVTVPQVAGFELESAKVQLVTGGLSMQLITRQVASSQPAGTVAYTTPEFGTPVPKGSIVKVFLSSGGKVVVPDIAGMDYTTAFATLQELGLTPSFPQPSQLSLNSRCNPTWPNDLAIGTSPAVGTEVSNASAILVIPNKCG